MAEDKGFYTQTERDDMSRHSFRLAKISTVVTLLAFGVASIVWGVKSPINGEVDIIWIIAGVVYLIAGAGMSIYYTYFDPFKQKTRPKEKKTSKNKEEKISPDALKHEISLYTHLAQICATVAAFFIVAFGIFYGNVAYNAAVEAYKAGNDIQAASQFTSITYGALGLGLVVFTVAIICIFLTIIFAIVAYLKTKHLSKYYTVKIN